jgi:predicted sugar kinase
MRVSFAIFKFYSRGCPSAHIASDLRRSNRSGISVRRLKRIQSGFVCADGGVVCALVCQATDDTDVLDQVTVFIGQAVSYTCTYLWLVYSISQLVPGV